MRYDFVDDLSCRNAVLSIAFSPALRLSAAVWTASVSDSLLESRCDCLAYVLQKLNTGFLGREVWLVAAHKTYQPDNRITRHNKLWKSLEKAGVDIPLGDRIDESVLTFESSIRAFGAIRCGVIQVKAINAVMTAAQGALIVMPKVFAEDSIKALVRRGWTMRNAKPPEEIVEVVAKMEGFVVDLFGEFDDPEVSVTAIGKKEVLKTLNLTS